MGRLIIDPEFRDKIPPLTEDEFIQLEENILSDGAVVSPLIVWDSVILDGHNRYEIIRKHPELVYAVHEMQFSNRYEALSWICRNQLGRRNLTPQQKKYLIGQRYEAEKQADAFHGNQHTLLDESGGDKICHHQNGKTRKRIAEEVGLSQGYVQNASSYAKGVDAAEEALPGIKQEILTGAIKPTETAVAAIAKAELRERPKLAAALKKSKDGRTHNPEKPQPVYHQSPPANSRREAIRQIEEISAEMERPKSPVTEDCILCSLDGEVVSFIEVCDNFFHQYPRLLSDSHYKHEVIRIMRKLSQYVIKLEGGQME